MYLEHFGLKELPFPLTHNSHFYCSLDAYSSAMNMINVSLENGEGFVKIIGEVGAGKTLLCRKLLNELDQEKYVTAYIANPSLDHSALYEAILLELGAVIPKRTRAYKVHELLSILNAKLLMLYKQQKHVVVIIDEAQTLSDELLEAVRLLSNVETESCKLLHIVLFGQPELDRHLARQQLRQLRQRIAFSYYLKPLTAAELEDYICFRLKAAGHEYGKIFSPIASKLLLKATSGIPRLINILCHKALLVAYSSNRDMVTARAMMIAIKDTDSAVVILKNYCVSNLVLASLLTIFVAELYYVLRSVL